MKKSLNEFSIFEDVKKASKHEKSWLYLKMTFEDLGAWGKTMNIRLYILDFTLKPEEKDGFSLILES